VLLLPVVLDDQEAQVAISLLRNAADGLRDV
jgi:hypothetical protein